MEANTPLDRSFACLLAAMAGWLPIVGFIGSLRIEVAPGLEARLALWVIQEVLFTLSAFCVLAFLYYLVGPDSRVAPLARTYAARASLIAFFFQMWAMYWLTLGFWIV